MSSVMMCTAVAMQVLASPAGIQVGFVPDHKQVQILDVSLLRDYVFVGKPGPDGVSPRGWVQYGGLGVCR